MVLPENAPSCHRFVLGNAACIFVPCIIHSKVSAIFSYVGQAVISRIYAFLLHWASWNNVHTACTGPFLSSPNGEISHSRHDLVDCHTDVNLSCNYLHRELRVGRRRDTLDYLCVFKLFFVSACRAISVHVRPVDNIIF